MTRGRKAESAEVKNAKGNPSRRPTGLVSTDVLPELKATAPRQLSAAGKAIWRDVAGQLGKIKLLRETDRWSLTRYCETLAEYWKVTRQLRKMKPTYEAKSIAGGKMIRLNPLVMYQDRLARRLDVQEERFGLTPRSRQEIMYRLAQRPETPRLPLNNPNKTPEQPPATSPVGFLNQTKDGPVH